MALTSPRFVSSRRLQNAANNSPTMKIGARGNSVRLIQHALLDLKYQLPITTTGMNSPDGIFGEETKAKVREFQKKHTLSDDGIIGKNTLAAFDRELAGYQHRVRLHFRSIALTRAPFELSLKSAQRVFAQYGIKVDFGSGESLALTPAQQAIFQRIDGTCDWSITSGEYHQLQSMGSKAPANEILVYYVKSFSSGDLGCGGHAPGRPAVTVAANASRWDTAHEVAHVLLTSSFSPVHSADIKNLMHATASSYASVPILTRKQVVRIRSHLCCHRI